MKKYWIVSLSCLALITSAFGAAQVEDKISSLYQKAGKSTVIITLKDRVTALELNSIRSTSAMKQALMKNLQESSISLKQRLNLLSEDTRILDELWTSNSLVAEVSNGVLSELASRDDIEQIILDGPVPMLKPVANPQEEPQEKDWTYGLKKLGVDKVRAAHSLTGKGVRVGILDTGIDPEHPDLKGKVINWKSFSSKGPATPADWHGHGTHVAGTIAGGSSSGTHIGVAPDVKLIVAQIFGRRGASKSGILKAMNWIADPDGNPDTDDHAQIVSNSWGAPKRFKFLERSRWKAVQNWVRLNMVPVFAAGNSGSKPKTIGVPAAYPHSFAIGAVDSSDTIAKFSSRGPVKWGRKSYIKPDISAAGVNVLSAKPGGGYQRMSGTSMATPHISGLAALLLEANPNLSVKQVQDFLTTTAEDLGASGQDQDYGWGRANILKAVKSLMGENQIQAEDRQSRFSTVHTH